MSKSILEIAVGFFVCIGLLAVAYLTFTLGEVSKLTGDSYTLKAQFQSVGGLKKGNRVAIGGVSVGRVEAINLDPKSFAANVIFSIDKGIDLDDDTIVSIKTSGLIGDQFLSLSPGGSGLAVEPNGVLYDTEPALDLESLIKKFAFGDLRKK